MRCWLKQNILGSEQKASKTNSDMVSVKLLEIGASIPDNYASCSSCKLLLMDGQYPDRFASSASKHTPKSLLLMSVHRCSAKRFDVISCRMVLNFVANS